MTLLLRLLLLGVVYVSASHLALPGAVGAELELGGAWTGEPTAEPAAALPTDQTAAAPFVASRPTPTCGPISFCDPGSARQDQPPAPGPVHRLRPEVTPAGIDLPVSRTITSSFLEQFQTGYRRAVYSGGGSSGRYLPMILDIFRQKATEGAVFTAMIERFDPVAVSRGPGSLAVHGSHRAAVRAPRGPLAR
jgi:hypothetical protein